jgi:hypothetical protein
MTTRAEMNCRAPESAADCLPNKAQNLARRALQLDRQGNGRHHLELVIIDGQWLLIVNGNGKLEDLGGG